MDILTIVVICFVLLVCLWAWFCFMRESFKDLKHIILMLKARKIIKNMSKEERLKCLSDIHSDEVPNKFLLDSFTDVELKEVLKDK